jgi:pyruvate dehydrogenase E2 component (dihydrolipoamide acetyltransferase)
MFDASGNNNNNKNSNITGIAFGNHHSTNPSFSCAIRSRLMSTASLYRATMFVRMSDSSSSLPYHLVVGLPALSPTMEVGTLSEWYKNEGDSFQAGDGLAKIETDKAAIDFEAQDDGVVAKILISANDGADSYVYIFL